MRSVDFEGELLQFAGSNPKATRNGFQTPVWPDDCPACGAHMEFDLGPVTKRVCVCGVKITAADLCGRSAIPLKKRRKAARA